MIRASFRAASRVFVALFMMAAALVALPRDAHAVYKFCASIDPVFVDSNIGEDRLKGRVTAAFHYMQITINGVLTAEGYSDANGCLNTTFSGAGTYAHGIYPRVRLGTSTTTVLERQTSTTLGGWIFTHSNLPASTGAAVTEKRSVLSGTTRDHLFRVSAVVEFLPFGLVAANTNYTIYARSPAAEAGCVACVSGNSMWLSNEPSNPALWTNQQKGVIAHEFGHFSQKDVFGYFGQTGQSETTKYCDQVSEVQCGCSFVAASPPSGFCGGEQIDRVHCLNSREHMFGAFPEGYAHMFASATLNITTETNATFPYYKALVNTNGTSAVPPPVPHQVLPSTPHRWMERRCH